MLTKIDVKELPSYNRGQQDGKLEVYTDVAIKLLPMMDDDKIAHVTSLPIEQIRALRESNTGD